MKALTSNVDGVGRQAGYATETGAYDWAHAILDSRNDKTACVPNRCTFRDRLRPEDRVATLERLQKLEKLIRSSKTV